MWREIWCSLLFIQWHLTCISEQSTFDDVDWHHVSEACEPIKFFGHVGFNRLSRVVSHHTKFFFLRSLLFVLEYLSLFDWRVIFINLIRWISTDYTIRRRIHKQWTNVQGTAWKRMYLEEDDGGWMDEGNVRQLANISLSFLPCRSKSSKNPVPAPFAIFPYPFLLDVSSRLFCSSFTSSSSYVFMFAYNFIRKILSVKIESIHSACCWSNIFFVAITN